MSVELNGIAHIQLTVNDPDRCLPFWERLCNFLEMKTLIKGEGVIYCIGSRTGILVRGAPRDKRDRRFDQDRTGLHHFCFRARSREDVDAVHRFLVDELDARIVHPPEDGAQFAPGYYSVLFEDPDGIRVEVNHVPGKGHFGPGGRLGPDGPGPATRYGSDGLRGGGGYGAADQSADLMGRYAHAFGPHRPAETYVSHTLPEQTFDTGEVELNYAVAGRDDQPALLLIPGQSESWWGYEQAMRLLAERFRVFAVDLRGQGRSTRTPGRYTLDNMGNDLVRFLGGVIGRPAIVSGLSSGGVLSAWLSAYALPGSIRGAHYEDPPLFHSEGDTSCGQSLRQAIGPMFALWSKYLGDQWSIGDWDGMVAAAPRELPAWLSQLASFGAEPSQNLKEDDPEWARAFWTGTVAASCDHARMLSSVKVPVLLTHHFRRVDGKTGVLMGALSDLSAESARELIASAGLPVEYRSFPNVGHAMHVLDPPLFTQTLVEWAKTLL